MTKDLTSAMFYDTILDVTREAGQFQVSHLNQHLQIEYKGDINLVTQVDKECERMIVSRIRSIFPDHDILAEEGSGGARKDSPYKWIIDPLDGTTNFAHRYPLFAVSIALEYQGVIVGGVVYDPNRDEMFQAFKEEGAFLNQVRIQASSASKLAQAMVATGFAYNLRETDNNNLDHFRDMLMTAQAVRRDGVAAIDLCYVACGRYDAFWELYLYPWDTAAGMIILSEAGGKVTRFDGQPYTAYDKDILASNGKIHGEMVSVLSGGTSRKL